MKAYLKGGSGFDLNVLSMIGCKYKNTITFKKDEVGFRLCMGGVL